MTAETHVTHQELAEILMPLVEAELVEPDQITTVVLPELELQAEVEQQIQLQVHQ
jgi:hypothetical protein